MILMDAVSEFDHCQSAQCEENRKMYRIVVFVLFNQAISQQVADKPSIRHARELIECCPCPSPKDGGQDKLVGGSQLARTGSLDDCPCRPDGADAEVASSIFFPSTARADGINLRSNDPKEDSKNLLEPEVTLAASMLDTLREATEEEYQDALARDAARSAIEPDTVPEESATNLVIIVNPRDFNEGNGDIMSESSHVQESRCIHPLSIPIQKEIKLSTPTNLLSQKKSFPNLKNYNVVQRNLLQEDSIVGASNVDPITDDTKKAFDFTLQSPVFKNTPIKSLIEYAELKKKRTQLDKSNETKSGIFERRNVPLAWPRIKFHKITTSNNDQNPAPGNIKNQLRVLDDKTIPLFRRAKLPLHLRNGLKLKDVEEIPKSMRDKPVSKAGLYASKLAMPSLLKKSNEINFRNNCDKEASSTINIVSSKESSSESNFIQQFNDTDKDSSESNNDILRECLRVVLDNSNDHVDQGESNMWTSASRVQTTIVEPNNHGKKEDIFDDFKEPSTIQLDGVHDESCETIEELNTPQTTEIVIIENESQDQNENILDNYSLHPECDSNVGESNIVPLLLPSEKQEREVINLLPQNNEYKESTNTKKDVTMNDLQDMSNKLLNLNANNQIDTISSEASANKFSNNDIDIISNEMKRESDHKSLRTIMDISEDGNPNYEKIICPVDMVLKSSKKEEILESQDIKQNVINDGESDRVIKTLPELFDPLASNMNLRTTILDDIADTSKVRSDILQKPLGQALNSNAELLTVNNHINLNPKEFNVETKNAASETVFDMDKGESLNYEKNANQIDMHNKTLKKEDVLESQNAKQTEMDTGASETITNILPRLFHPLTPNLKLRTPLLDDIVNSSKDQLKQLSEPLQQVLNTKPSLLWDNLNAQLPKDPLIRRPLEKGIKLNSDWPSLVDFRERSSFLKDKKKPLNNPLNLLSMSPKDSLNINTHLATIDDLQDHFASIFKSNEINSEEESSFEGDNTHECSEEIMTPEASTTKMQSKFAKPNRLQDFSVDVFGNKPLTITNNLAKRSRLNSRLNSYRAETPSLRDPELNFASKLRQAGENTDKLTCIENNKKLAARTSKPLEILPFFDELRNTLQSNAKILPSRPVQPNFNPLEKKLRSNNDIEDITETLRLNTQNTIKGMQQKLKSSLRKTKPNNLINHSLAKPQELLDDVHDKLKGIHYDLNDRLSSIHEDILDSPQIKTLFDRPRIPTNRNVMTNLRPQKTRQHPTRLQTAASTIMLNKVDPDKYNSIHSSLGENPKNSINRSEIKEHNIQTSAESFNLPTKQNSPQISSSLLDNIRQNPSLTQFLKDRKPFSPSLRETIKFKDIKRPIFRTAANPYKNENQPNKVTISFGTTTAMPTITSEPVSQAIVPSTLLLPFKERDLTTLPSLHGQPFREKLSALNHGLKSSGDSKNVPVQFLHFQNLTPMPRSFDEEFEGTPSSISYGEKENYKSKLKPPVLRTLPINEALPTNYDKEKLKSPKKVDNYREITQYSNKFPTQSTYWTKENENIFLPKVRSSGNKMTNFDNRLDSRAKNIEKDDSMLRSSSKNSNIILDEPLKENVSYRCSMVCTKELN